MAKILYDEHGNPVKVKRRGGCLRSFIIIVLLVWGASFFVNSKKDDEINSTTEEATSIEVETDDPFKQAAYEVFEDRLIDYQANTIDPIHYLVKAETPALSHKMDVKDANFKTRRYLEKIQDLEYDSLSILFFGDFIDQYGNSEEQKAISFHFTKETVDKINFDNFLPENLPDIANEYWKHPAFNN